MADSVCTRSTIRLHSARQLFSYSSQPRLGRVSHDALPYTTHAISATNASPSREYKHAEHVYLLRVAETSLKVTGAVKGRLTILAFNQKA